MPETYLWAIASDLGEQRRIDAPTDDTSLSNRTAELLRDGFEHYRVSGDTVLDMAATASSRCLDLAGINRLGGIVLSSQTVGATASAHDDLWDYQRTISHPSVTLLTAGGMSCGNFGPALVAARGLGRSEEGGPVLAVTADAVAPAGARYLPSAAAVLSDGAAAWLVGTDPPAHLPHFRIAGLALRAQADAELSTSGIRAAAATAKLIKETAGLAAARSDVAMRDVRYVLTGHFGRDARWFAGMAAGFAKEKVYAGRIHEVGHCFAADIPVDLAALAESGPLDDGDAVMCLATSPRTWAAILLIHVAPATSIAL